MYTHKERSIPINEIHYNYHKQKQFKTTAITANKNTRIQKSIKICIIHKAKK